MPETILLWCKTHKTKLLAVGSFVCAVIVVPLASHTLEYLVFIPLFGESSSSQSTSEDNPNWDLEDITEWDSEDFWQWAFEDGPELDLGDGIVLPEKPSRSVLPTYIGDRLAPVWGSNYASPYEPAFELTEGTSLPISTIETDLRFETGLPAAQPSPDVTIGHASMLSSPIAMEKTAGKAKKAGSMLSWPTLPSLLSTQEGKRTDDTDSAKAQPDTREQSETMLAVAFPVEPLTEDTFDRQQENVSGQSQPELQAPDDNQEGLFRSEIDGGIGEAEQVTAPTNDEIEEQPDSDDDASQNDSDKEEPDKEDNTTESQSDSPASDDDQEKLFRSEIDGGIGEAEQARAPTDGEIEEQPDSDDNSSKENSSQEDSDKEEPDKEDVAAESQSDSSASDNNQESSSESPRKEELDDEIEKQPDSDDDASQNDSDKEEPDKEDDTTESQSNSSASDNNQESSESPAEIEDEVMPPEDEEVEEQPDSDKAFDNDDSDTSNNKEDAAAESEPDAQLTWELEDGFFATDDTLSSISWLSYSTTSEELLLLTSGNGQPTSLSSSWTNLSLETDNNQLGEIVSELNSGNAGQIILVYRSPRSITFDNAAISPLPFSLSSENEAPPAEPIPEHSSGWVYVLIATGFLARLSWRKRR